MGPDAQVRLVLSRVSDPAGLRARWSSSGAAVELVAGRLHATTTVEALARAAGRSLERDEALRLDAVLREAVHAWGAPAPLLELPDGSLPTDRRPLIMGVLNVTPDSFSDGGQHYPHGHPEAAVERGIAMVEEGADVIDVGGESTRPGAEPVAEAEELERVIPVVKALASQGVIVSIDTVKAEVARAALAAGARLVNDVSGARDPELLRVTAAAGAAYVLMHSRGTPGDMQQQTDYGDVIAEVAEFLTDGLVRCAQAGIDPERVVLDPGIGFAKEAHHSLALLRELRQFRSLARPVLVGASRKSFLGAVLGGAGVDERLEASLAAVAIAVAQGAAIIRVHDVGASVRVARTVHALEAGLDAWNLT